MVGVYESGVGPAGEVSQCYARASVLGAMRFTPMDSDAAGLPPSARALLTRVPPPSEDIIISGRRGDCHGALPGGDAQGGN